MLPEIGTFAIILALILALVQTSSFLSFFSKNLAKTSAIGQLIFLSMAMLSLIICFIQNDFTVAYVQQHSHKTLPLIFKIGAAWGGHEGSLLLWSLILAGWNSLFALFGAQSTNGKTPAISTIFHSQVLSTLGLISAGFLIFLLFTSNPFLRDFKINAPSGVDLTPVLQDIGLIFHPPMLYSGYVGFAIAFAFAAVVLLKKQIEPNWARALRFWVLIPWSLLGGGIVLGSWWSYRELGWGGWWFWDPVENASLMPWLAATALLHSLIVTEKKQSFAGWTLLLALLTFSLSLLGTFLVRSGVLVSVHAFAADPTRGIFLLSYLAIIIGGGLIIFALRSPRFYQPTNFASYSRETLLLINTIIQLTAVVILLTGTLYPIILDAMNLGKISVGEPYYRTLFTPLMLFMIFLMVFAPKIKWNKSTFLAKRYFIALGLGLIFAIGFPLIMSEKLHWLTTIGLTIASGMLLITLNHIKLKKPSAMVIAHSGIAIIAIGIIVNQTYQRELQLRISPQETVHFAGYDFYFNNEETIHKSNFIETNANIDITQNKKAVGTLSAKERLYQSHQQILSHPGILLNFFRDLYIAPGNRYQDGSWTIRIYYKPFVRWIWGGGLITLLAGLVSVFKKRKFR